MDLSSKIHSKEVRLINKIGLESDPNLRCLFLLANVICEMKISIVERKMKGIADDKLKKNQGMVDDLFEVYKGFDAFYSSAHLSHSKLVHSERINLQLATEVLELRAERDKLLATIAFNESA